MLQRERVAVIVPLLLFTLSARADPGDQELEYSYVGLDFHYRHLTIEPGMPTLGSSYSGSTMYVPGIFATNYSDSFYLHLDWSGAFALVAQYLHFGWVSASKAASDPGAGDLYAPSFRGLRVPRFDVGIPFRLGNGLGGVGLMFDNSWAGLGNGQYGSGSSLAGGVMFDAGLQARYAWTLYPGVRVAPCFTFAAIFNESTRNKADGYALIFETEAAIKIAPVVSVVGTVEYTRRSFDAPQSLDTTTSSEFAITAGLGFHDLWGYGHN